MKMENCLICLLDCRDVEHNDNISSRNKLSLQNLCRFINLDAQDLNLEKNCDFNSSDNNINKIKVPKLSSFRPSLCHDCGTTLGNLSELWGMLELIQMQMVHHLEAILKKARDVKPEMAADIDSEGFHELRTSILRKCE